MTGWAQGRRREVRHHLRREISIFRSDADKTGHLGGLVPSLPHCVEPGCKRPQLMEAVDSRSPFPRGRMVVRCRLSFAGMTGKMRGRWWEAWRNLRWENSILRTEPDIRGWQTCRGRSLARDGAGACGLPCQVFRALNITCLSGCPGLALPSCGGLTVEGLKGRTGVMVHAFYNFGKGRVSVISG